MGHFFRSQDMCLIELIVPSNIIYEAVGITGEIDLLQFRDLNANVNAFQRNFVQEVRKCDQMERVLRFFAMHLESNGICADAELLLGLDCCEKYALPLLHEIDDMERQLQEIERQLREVEENEKNLRKNLVDVLEFDAILKESHRFFDEAEKRTFEPDTLNDVRDLESQSGGVKLGFITGVVNRDKVTVFERVLWRTCYGNVFVRRSEVPEPILDPETMEPVLKDVFIVFFQGKVLEKKVKRVCDGFSAKIYSCPEPFSERCSLQERVKSSLGDLNLVLERTTDHKMEILAKIAKNYETWAVSTRKVKATYYVLNMFNYDVSESALVGEAWCPTEKLEEVQNAMERVRARVGNPTPIIVKNKNTKDVPPTYQVTNKFTAAFQVIIDSYGVADYKEVNPTIFALISFPFLFGVMFGDIGHGILMSMFAGYMVVREKSLITIRDGGEFWNTIFGGRYIILLMGLFSVYTGIIYNDMFSKSLWVFDSAYVLPQHEYNGSITLSTNSTVMPLSAACPQGCGYDGNGPYPFGVDPIWALASNKLSFMNSFKMKMSVLLGVTHMLFGLFLSAFNHVHFKDKLKIYCDFVPQFLFMFSIFGYLCILIISKWLSVFPPLEDGTQTDPSILIILINMFLSPSLISYKEKTRFYSGQEGLQKFLVIVAIVCIPWMLLARPLILRHRHKKAADLGYARVNSRRASESGDDEALLCNDSDEEGHGFEQDAAVPEFDFADMMVGQSIHTIEYCLGAVSNTASYLRLWALSLAHAQLSEVLWTMLFVPALNGNALFVFLGFGAWAILSLGVLLGMEGMSAFLHALRLHWVEFNGKFYHGGGYPFVPFSFKVAIQEAMAANSNN